MMYLGWYDDNAKTPVVEKIAAGAAAFLARCKFAPKVCLCNEADRGQIVSVNGVVVRTGTTVNKDCFWIGVD